MCKTAYDVIIIGAGPAGLSTAINLFERGVTDVLVVERAKFPRYKCCAGYITKKTCKEYEKLGLDIRSCNYSLIKDFNVLYKFRKKINIENKFLYTNRFIERVELDNAFFELAAAKGIEVRENLSIREHSLENNCVTLSDGKAYSYNYLVFADGTTSFGNRYRKNKKCNIAMQLTFESDMPEAIDIHFGITRRGYGWVSTYGGVTNIGLTDVYKTGSKDYAKVFKEFTEKLGVCVDIKDLKAAFTPIGVRKAVLGSNVYFVGDAAGACDPLTLSGLRYGLESGKYCAEAILRSKPKYYKKYLRKLKIRFAFMKTMQKVFYLKCVMFLTFNVLCTCFGKMVERVFNNFFVNKK